jgi:hypothetical protein
MPQNQSKQLQGLYKDALDRRVPVDVPLARRRPVLFPVLTATFTPRDFLDACA